MLVVSERGIIAEAYRWLSGVDRCCNSFCPIFETVELCLGKHGSLHASDEFGQRADINAYCVSARNEGFDQCGAATDVIVEHKFARLRERFDCGASKTQGKTWPDICKSCGLVHGPVRCRVRRELTPPLQRQVAPIAA